MKEINIILKFIKSKEVAKNIKDVLFSNQGEMYKRMAIELQNGIIVSIITGKGAYCNEKRPFEIAFMDARTLQHDWMPEIFDANDAGDDVSGYKNADDVNYYIQQAIRFRA